MIKYIIYSESTGDILRQGRCAHRDLDLIPLDSGEVISEVVGHVEAASHVVVGGNPMPRETPKPQQVPFQNPNQLTANEIKQLRQLLQQRGLSSPGD